jgi:hypothetical protein
MVVTQAETVLMPPEPPQRGEGRHGAGSATTRELLTRRWGRVPLAATMMTTMMMLQLQQAREEGMEAKQALS